MRCLSRDSPSALPAQSCEPTIGVMQLATQEKAMTHTLLAVLIGSTLTGGIAHAAATYAVTDLGTLGGSASEAYGLNNSGQVVGWARTAAGAQHAFLYSAGVMTDLGSLGGGSSLARDVNNSGRVVGDSWTSSGGIHAFVTASGGGLIDLGAIGGNRSSGYGINDSNQVVGGTSLGSPTLGAHAFVYSTQLTDLGILTGGSYSTAYGINSNGLVVGSSDSALDYNQHAVLYTALGIQDLGTQGLFSAAYAINDSGQIVGRSGNTGALFTAFGTLDLGALGGYHSQANGINNLGQIVGWATNAGDQRRAFVYSSGSLSNLNSLIDPLSGWQIEDARDINDAGQIAAFGCNASTCHALLLTPVPEPQTWAMLLTGLCFVGLRLLKGHRQPARALPQTQQTLRRSRLHPRRRVA